MNRPCTASIIINNYNYADFLGDAIESALHQTYPHAEVIVVDDGSNDASRAIIARYGDRIIPVFKENGGQASAFNAGFSRSRGEIVIFLDADDMLLPDVMTRVAAAFAADPTTARVQYRMQDIDATGRLIGSVRPPRHIPMPNGDIRRSVLQFPDDIPYQPTSGNALARWMLRQIFPVPEQAYRICADVYMTNVSSLFGPVISLDAIGGLYRMHGANNHTDTTLRLDRTRQIIVATGETHRHLKRFADALGLSGFPRESKGVLSVTFIAHRMISLKLAPYEHPVSGDTLMTLLATGVRGTVHHFDFPVAKKLLYIGWFTAMLPAPTPIARWLATRLFHAGSPRRVERALTTSIRALRAIGNGAEAVPCTRSSTESVTPVSRPQQGMDRPVTSHANARRR